MSDWLQLAAAIVSLWALAFGLRVVISFFLREGI